MSTNQQMSYLAHPASLATAAAFCALTGCDKVWGSFIDELPPTPPVMCTPGGDPGQCPTGSDCSPATSTCVAPADMAMSGGDDLAGTTPDLAMAQDMAMAPAGMIYMAAATFNVGATCGNDQNGCHQVFNYTLPKSYWLDATEVTWEKYQIHSLACKDPGQATEAKSRVGCTAQNGSPTDSAVQCVTYFEADCYCKKLGKRLPTEEEWEYASVGKTGYQWPWGSTFQAAKVCYNNVSTACKVGSKGQTLQGMSVASGGFSDLVGNMREWTTSNFCVVLGQDGCSAGDPRKAQRGGSWDAPQSAASVQHRVGYAPLASVFFDNLGFRCALDAQ